MGTDEGQRALRTAYWEAKLAAEKQLLDVVRHVERGEGDFVLLDARDRNAYEQAHIPGALSIPVDSVPEVGPILAPDREYVVYCWRST
jgi:rhodanese-related sulfurtransferase